MISNIWGTDFIGFLRSGQIEKEKKKGVKSGLERKIGKLRAPKSRWISIAGRWLSGGGKGSTRVRIDKGGAHGHEVAAWEQRTG